MFIRLLVDDGAVYRMDHRRSATVSGVRGGKGTPPTTYDEFLSDPLCRQSLASASCSSLDVSGASNERVPSTPTWSGDLSLVTIVVLIVLKTADAANLRIILLD